MAYRKPRKNRIYTEKARDFLLNRVSNYILKYVNSYMCSQEIQVDIRECFVSLVENFFTEAKSAKEEFSHDSIALKTHSQQLLGALTQELSDLLNKANCRFSGLFMASLRLELYEYLLILCSPLSKKRKRKATGDEQDALPYQASMKRFAVRKRKGRW